MSATVLRELVAELGLKVDEKAFEQADKGLARVKDDLVKIDGRMRDARGRFIGGARGMASAAGELGRATGKAAQAQAGGGLGDTIKQYLGAAVVGSALSSMVELASAANETQNVIEQVFGAAGQQMVNAWAQNEATRLGRSYYALVANTGALGAMLQPMTGSADAARVMSQRFATLAVDLASFFNTTDDEALAALKSGISGETEPLKKFGIVMQDATLAEYAHTQGITKKFQAMNVAEKTALRYNFILSQTTKATDDAERTASGFANSSRRLKDRLRDVATTIGMRLLPAAGQLVEWAERAVDLFVEFDGKTNILNAAFVVLGGTMLRLFSGQFLKLARAAWPIILITLAVDELITTIQGGDTYLRDFFNFVFGEEATSKGLAQLAHDWKALVDAISAVDWAAKWAGMRRTVADWAQATILTMRKVRFETQWFLGTSSRSAAAKEAAAKGDLATNKRLYEEGLAEALGDDPATVAEEAARRGASRKRFDDARAARLAAAEAADAEAQAAYENQQGLWPSAGNMSSAAPAYAGGPVMSSAPTSIVVNNNLQMSVTPSDAALELGRKAQRAIALERRGTEDALRKTIGK